MLLRTLFTAGVALALAAPLGAQQDIPRLPPGMTPAQARELLRQRPELQERLRRWIVSSGLSANEIRTRLRAAGYPGDLLDQYLRDLGADSTGAGALPTVQTLDAVRELGIGEPTAGDSLLAEGDSVAARLYRDSVAFARMEREDSLRARRLAEGRLPLFGNDVFRRAGTAFDPIVPGPVDDAYVLGVGDVLAVILTGATESAFTTDVLPDGSVLLPQAGRVAVANLSLGEARRLLFNRLRAVYATLGEGPDARTRLNVTVTQVRMNSVRVVGEASQPGTYQLAATGGVLSALYAAGGPTSRGSLRNVEVRRGNRLIASVDLYEFLMGGTVTNDVALAPGDVIFIPQAGPRARIAGSVRRAAIYELRPGEGIQDLVRYAGGLTFVSATEAATLTRIGLAEGGGGSTPTRTVHTIPLGAVLAGNAPPVLVGDGDSLMVYTIPADRRREIAVTGAVNQPGGYGLAPGMRLWDAIAAAGGLRPESYRGRVQVLRTLPDSSRVMLGVAVPDDGDGPPADNPALQDGDSITVFARTAFRPPRWVAVGGAVQAPDTFAFADSMTLRDAVLLAGGLTDGASLTEALVTRVRLDAGDQVAETIRVPLDSSYVFDASSYLTRPAGRDAPEFVLRPYDAVTVRTQPGWVEPQRVVVTGEVADPGTYLLAEPVERLSAVVARAGGIGPRALPGGIVLYRRSLVGGRQRVGVDLARALARPGGDQDLPLLPGDSIHIPAYDATVRVEGAVNAPTAVRYRPGAGIGYYVAAAGGWAQDAHRSQTYVMLGNGIIERGGEPGPGSTVVVPARDLTLTQPSIWPQILSTVASIASTLVTIVVVLVR